MYLCIDFASYYDFDILFLNYSDGVLFLFVLYLYNHIGTQIKKSVCVCVWVGVGGGSSKCGPKSGGGPCFGENRKVRTRFLNLRA